MEAASIVVAVILVLIIIGAAYWTYKSLHTKSCCGSDKNCTAGATKHCSIRKEKDD